MTSIVAGLKELHTLRLKLEQVQGELDQGPRKVAARERVTANKQQAVESCREKLTSLRKRADEKSLQLKSNEAKLVDLKAKLNSAASNREFDIIKGQIEADQMANSVLEDEILEAYEQVDVAQAELKDMEQALQTARDAVQQCQQEVDAARAGLQSQIADLEQQVKVAEQIVPGEARGQYDRLVQAFGAGALAHLQNKACSACFNNISAQDTVKLNVGKLVFCRTCGRLLYLAD